MPDLEKLSRSLKAPPEFPQNGRTPSQAKIASLESQLLTLQTTLSESLNEMSKHCEENFNLTERVCELEQALYDMSAAERECNRRKNWLEDELNRLRAHSPLFVPTETTRGLSTMSAGVSRAMHSCKSTKRSDYTLDPAGGSVKTLACAIPSRMQSTPSPSPNITLRTPARISRSRALPNTTANNNSLQCIPSPNTRIPVLSASYESRINPRPASQPLASPLHIGSSHASSQTIISISRSRSTGDVPSPSILKSKTHCSPQPVRTSRSSHVLSSESFGVFDSKRGVIYGNELFTSPIRRSDKKGHDDVWEEGASAWNTLAGSRPDWTGFDSSPEGVVNTDKLLKHMYTPPTMTAEDERSCFLAESNKENYFGRSPLKTPHLLTQRPSVSKAGSKFSTRIPASTSFRSKFTRTAPSFDQLELGFESSDRFDSQRTLVDLDLSSASTRTRVLSPASPTEQPSTRTGLDGSRSSLDRKPPFSSSHLSFHERNPRSIQNAQSTNRSLKKVIPTRYEAGSSRTTRITRTGYATGG
ncbi:hypothetical protein [Phaffia rhodozyma]|uniref:Uncharacterized protein n=1 Tax=Phaffia rhodozyma TaxID=264483 RepID=A0A0F7SRR5_PHARH|nr:hypothetical protein [Phaffia rhodozyma]